MIFFLSFCSWMESWVLLRIKRDYSTILINWVLVNAFGLNWSNRASLCILNRNLMPSIHCLKLWLSCSFFINCFNCTSILYHSSLLSCRSNCIIVNWFIIWQVFSNIWRLWEAFYVKLVVSVIRCLKIRLLLLRMLRCKLWKRVYLNQLSILIDVLMIILWHLNGSGSIIHILLVLFRLVAH